MSETIRPSADFLRSSFRALFFDIARLTSPYLNAEKDMKYLLNRLEREGSIFALKTLPLLGKAFETALITGEAFVCPTNFHRFSKTSRLPLFLHDLFRKVMTEEGNCLFHYEGGYYVSSIKNQQSHHHGGGGNPNIRVSRGGKDAKSIPNRDLACEGFHNKSGAIDAPDNCLESALQASQAVRAIRQLTLCFSKAVVDVRGEIRDNSVKEFLGRITASPSQPRDGEILSLARELLRRTFTGDTPDLRRLRSFQKEPWGRHGPGAVAGQECGWEKWHADSWAGLPRNLFSWHPSSSYVPRRFLPGQPPARICAVPKDFRGPRIICIEPKENQFAQQGIMEILYAHIQSHSLTRRSISFEDVTLNRQLCYRDYSTIDMKDASDRISLSLIKLLFPKWVYRLVTRYRTRYVTWNGNLYRSTCFASMGSALCFPIETLVFWAIARSAMYRVTSSFNSNVRRHLDQTLLVFGDDIIVPPWACDAVVEALESCNLVVNRDKTCHMSPVKESCGEWSFLNRDCGVVKLHNTDVKDHASWIQAGDYIPLFEKYGYFAMSEFLRESRDLVYPESSFKRRFNKDLQRSEVRVPILMTKGRKESSNSTRRLYAWSVGNDVTPYLRGAWKQVKWGWTECNF